MSLSIPVSYDLIISLSFLENHFACTDWNNNYILQGDVLAADKIFSGSGSLKSRKIAISSIDKSKVFTGKYQHLQVFLQYYKSDLFFIALTDDILGYKKSDIAAAQASIEEASSKDIERFVLVIMTS